MQRSGGKEINLICHTGLLQQNSLSPSLDLITFGETDDVRLFSVICKGLLADVNSVKTFPVFKGGFLNVIFCTINKTLKIPETFAQSSRKLSIVYDFGLL